MGAEERARKPFPQRHKLTSQGGIIPHIPPPRLFITHWVHHRDVSCSCELSEVPGSKIKDKYAIYSKDLMWYHEFFFVIEKEGLPHTKMSLESSVHMHQHGVKTQILSTGHIAFPSTSLIFSRSKKIFHIPLYV